MARSRTRKRSTRRTAKAHPRGVFLSRGADYGFVQTPEGEFFISATDRAGAFEGDLVEVSPVRSRSGKGSSGEGSPMAANTPAARVLRVVDRAHDTVIGRYEVAEPFGVVVPADKRIPYDVFTLRAQSPEVPDGALVRVRMTEYPTRKNAATGVVEEVLGMADDDDAGIDLIIARHKLETRFSKEALGEADEAAVNEAAALTEGYRDLTDRFVFTVDPADARDFDDALSLDYVLPAEGRTFADLAQEGFFNGAATVSGNGERRSRRGLWRLGIHIADVASYAPWNSSVDLDARRRGTSVYLADRVIPMLPPKLSDDVCSLRPGEVRRSMTVDVYLTDEAEVVGYDIYPALIRSDIRLSYDRVMEIFIEYKEASAVGVPTAWRLVQCSRLAKLRSRLRHRAGGIDFSTREAKVVLDGEGRPVDIKVRVKNEATELVEEAMILANEIVAAYLTEKRWPCAYRVHEAPAAESLAALVPVFSEFDWFSAPMARSLVQGDPATIQTILAASADRSEGELVSNLLLRAMRRAVYSPVNDGHYGLASMAYCHFTSPIRRYPDLMVHRFLKSALTHRPEKFDQEVAALSWICEHSSAMERIADEAARQSQVLKMIEYLEPSVGKAFSAVISGVAAFGLFARLECTAEGLIPLRALGDEYFAFDPDRHTLTGEATGRVYRLGQRVAVVISAADARTNTLEFRLA